MIEDKEFDQSEKKKFYSKIEKQILGKFFFFFFLKKEILGKLVISLIKSLFSIFC